MSKPRVSGFCLTDNFILSRDFRLLVIFTNIKPFWSKKVLRIAVAAYLKQYMRSGVSTKDIKLVSAESLLSSELSAIREHISSYLCVFTWISGRRSLFYDSHELRNAY